MSRASAGGSEFRGSRSTNGNPPVCDRCTTVTAAASVRQKRSNVLRASAHVAPAIECSDPPNGHFSGVPGSPVTRSPWKGR